MRHLKNSHKQLLDAADVSANRVASIEFSAEELAALMACQET